MRRLIRVFTFCYSSSSLKDISNSKMSFYYQAVEPQELKHRQLVYYGEFELVFLSPYEISETVEIVTCTNGLCMTVGIFVSIKFVFHHENMPI